eukprot:255870-Amphidinium_carterae.1
MSCDSKEPSSERGMVRVRTHGGEVLVAAVFLMSWVFLVFQPPGVLPLPCATLPKYASLLFRSVFLSLCLESANESFVN